MRYALLVVLAGCTLDTRLGWNLDAASCARLHATTVEWVWVRDDAVVEQIGFPCDEGMDGVLVEVPEEPYTMVVSLEDAGSHVLQHCTPALGRHGWSCDFVVP